MGSDPLRLTRPVNGFNLPNARGRSLGLSPLSFSASRSPMHSPGTPPAARRRRRRFRRPWPKFRREGAKFRPRSTGSRCRKPRRFGADISGGFRLNTGAKLPLIAGFRRGLRGKGMRCYFVMMMLDVVDLSELVLICDVLHNIFAMGKLVLEGLILGM